MNKTSAIEMLCGKCENRFWTPKKVQICPICEEERWVKAIGEVTITPKTQEKCPYEDVRQLWNNICVSFPSIVSITDKRRASLRCRWEQLGNSLTKFEDAFRKLEASSFCKGDNDKNWMASFDWIISNQTNIIKVLEGKYDDVHGKGMIWTRKKGSQAVYGYTRNLNDLVE